MKKKIPEETLKLLKYIDATPTPYHAAEELARMLEESGAERLCETDKWDKLVPGKNYYLIRNDSCIAAFRLGKHSPETAGWHISLSHIDYPCLRIRPNPTALSESYERICAETYGGLIHHSWFDRPLGLAGRVYLKADNACGMRAQNVDFKRPLLVIPELAIHMNNGVNEGAKFNPQTEMLPVFSQNFKGEKGFAAFLAASLKVKPEDILSWDLSAYDCQKACTTGENDEFISAPHLDDGEMAFCSFKGFIDALGRGKDGPAPLPDFNSVAIAYDHEEVGSVSDRGARSNFLTSLLGRIHENIGSTDEDITRSMSGSVVCSGDMAHASHPSYPGTFDADHKIYLNKGPVLKHSFSQSYIESPKASAIFRKYCSDNSVPFQEFVNRNDMRSGSTVGPASASSIGAIGFDIGNPIFSMHSIREFGGTYDVKYATDFFRAFHR